MKKILDVITAKMQKAFEEAGYEPAFAGHRIQPARPV